MKKKNTTYYPYDAQANQYQTVDILLFGNSNYLITISF